MHADLPKPPFYAVIFTSQRTAGDKGYEAMADRMFELAKTMKGYLGAESVRGTDGFGITVSYWQTQKDIAVWKQETEHMVAQAKGKSDWYQSFRLRISKVERMYGWERP